MKELCDDGREEMTGWWKELLQITSSCSAESPLKREGQASIPAHGGRSRRRGLAGKQFRGRRREACLRVPPGL